MYTVKKLLEKLIQTNAKEAKILIDSDVKDKKQIALVLATAISQKKIDVSKINDLVAALD